ncbi:MAG TPA: tetraacyldisaccharide 4'-kinase [bacterium]|nr:tetraacyldisaccharide 4'-kinase [bacterium]
MFNPPAAAASFVYAVGVQADRLLDGLRGGVRTRTPVVSVGNLAAGGSGKTPLVHWLTRRLEERGLAAGVVARGYRGSWAHRTARPALVRDLSVQEAGDEAALLAKRLPRAEVAVCRVKARAAELLDPLNLDLILVDDGLQHRRLARDYDIAVLERGDWLGYVERGTRLVPWGRMREPFVRLERVDAVVFWDASEEEARRLSLRFPAPLMLRARREPVELAPDGGELPPGGLSGRRVIAFCGVARPTVFFDDLRALGVELVETRAFPDHARYDARRFGELRRLMDAHPGDLPVTTAKDAVKIPSGALDGLRVLDRRVVFAGEDGARLLGEVGAVARRCGRG